MLQQLGGSEVPEEAPPALIKTASGAWIFCHQAALGQSCVTPSPARGGKRSPSVCLGDAKCIPVKVSCQFYWPLGRWLSCWGNSDRFDTELRKSLRSSGSWKSPILCVTRLTSKAASARALAGQPQRDPGAWKASGRRLGRCLPGEEGRMLFKVIPRQCGRTRVLCGGVGSPVAPSESPSPRTSAGPLWAPSFHLDRENPRSVSFSHSVVFLSPPK